MPIKRAALRQMHKDRRRHTRNIALLSELHTLTKQYLRSVGAKQTDQANALLRTLVSKLDRAVTKGVLHRNTASRNKSRLTRKLASAAAK